MRRADCGLYISTYVTVWSHKVVTPIELWADTNVHYKVARVCARHHCTVQDQFYACGMELRVGSNIMIHFLYILLLLIWHMYLYIIHC